MARHDDRFPVDECVDPGQEPRGPSARVSARLFARGLLGLRERIASAEAELAAAEPGSAAEARARREVDNDREIFRVLLAQARSRYPRSFR